MEVNAVIQSRDLTLYQKSYAEEPAFPANTVAAGADISGYTKRQATDGGVGFTAQQDFTGVFIDQRPNRLYSIQGQQTVQINAQLAELTATNMQLATAIGDVETLAATVTAYGHEQLVAGKVRPPEYNTYLLDVPQPINRLPFRIFVPLGQSEGSVNFTISPTQKGIINLVVSALLDESYEEADFPDITDFGGILFIARRVTPMAAA